METVEVCLNVHYERPYSNRVYLDIPVNLVEGSDEWHEYVQDNLPVIEAYAEDWDVA